MLFRVHPEPGGASGRLSDVRPESRGGSDALTPTTGTRRPTEVLASSSLHRITDILGALISGRPVTRTSLARTINTSPSTIKRDIDTVRDVLGVDIEYDPPRMCP